ncbi:YtxH domain-containing protein [Lihuaxuella thermophila]|uniref:Gas vesicle protein n=1 Tax=Lihuaxuella thermophila TaxID=1173111 RepID=A0A1H8AGT5_9BACL|nr:YtxH domain-containing protein [Lihuaxuella thermophila]SEM69753.1 Gas vesicle protein [Lihuaxuella thermophila]
MGDQNNGIQLRDFLIGALFGGLVGAAVVLLTTPKTGREMREDLSKSLETAKEKSAGVVDKLIEVRNLLGNTLSERNRTIPIRRVTKIASKETAMKNRFPDVEAEEIHSDRLRVD